MWAPEHHPAAKQHGLRYPSDLNDAQWNLVEPLIPSVKRSVDLHELLNGILYVQSTGCQRNAMLLDLPPKSTVYDYFELQPNGKDDHSAVCSF
tara:strand:- start:2389 stop:2667 length:279 start_codon:yes stop_codon:yes gene_type:complete